MTARKKNNISEFICGLVVPRLHRFFKFQHVFLNWIAFRQHFIEPETV